MPENEQHPSPWTSVLMALVLCSGALLVTGPLSGWVVPPVVAAVVFVVCVFAYIGVVGSTAGARRRR